MSTTTIGEAFERRGSYRDKLALLLIWVVLLTVPLWLPAIGGYTSLAARILVFALAAMGLNFLLGFTGVMSFGHAAYFGLGAYGCGLTLFYVTNSTLLAILAGLAGVLAGGQIGLNPNMGDDLLLPAFIAIIVGGVGSLIGTLIGGIVIGVAAALTTVFFPSGSEVVIYVIMIVVLLVRPRGLLGEEGMLT